MGLQKFLVVTVLFVVAITLPLDVRARQLTNDSKMSESWISLSLSFIRGSRWTTRKLAETYKTDSYPWAEGPTSFMESNRKKPPPLSNGY